MSAASLLYSAAQVRALDAYAIAQGTSGYTLMKRAGEAALRALRSRWPRALEIAVVAGGVEPLSYQWYIDGVPIAKASGSTLSVPAAKLASEGNYMVVVSNALGATSAVASLTIAETTKPTLKVAFPANNFTSTSSSIRAADQPSAAGPGTD